MASRSAFSLQCSLPNGRNVSNSEIDAWELKVARRGLQNLKTLLEGQPMLDLLAKQIEEGDAYFKDIIARSNGQFKESRVDFSANGITSSQFLEWFTGVDASGKSVGTRHPYLDNMAPAHPEHYSLGPYPLGIVENIGQHICRVRIEITAEIPDFVLEYGNSAYDKKLAVTCYLDDGTIFFYGFQEFQDRENGFDFRMRIIFPVASPQILIDEHTEHLAIEFRSFIAAAYESLHG
ncbi:hypothetical protein N7481_008503 [Penicillium waksmanii]|uniref:uncharacterized protein n=1 Tax=Penicillium waksmanii TaxID=69791 RepID=UPI00254853E2|nr:uncharacterized protein N7481_008503 [Penicillium waksmanii]KAJ5974796.1 hypothetical protein N7481_008503 [Penicillium waksmanii]